MWLSAALLELGALGLAAGLLLQAPWIPVPALAAAAAFGVFLAQIVWMLRNRRPAPTGRPRPFFHLWHVGLALACLLLSLALGLVLALTPVSDYTTGPAAVYGVLGLIGFFAQMVAGVEIFLLPLFSAVLSIARGKAGDLPSPHTMAHRGMLAAAFFLWAAAIPALAAGMGLQSAPLAGIGGACLLGAAALGALNSALILRHAFC
jgi:hypothetical protein